MIGGVAFAGIGSCFTDGFCEWRSRMKCAEGRSET